MLGAEEGRASTDRNSQDDGDPWWQLVGVLLPPFLHGLCLCADLPGVADGMLPSLASTFTALLVKGCNQSTR